MASPYVIIGISIGVFFAGLGIGYAIFSANQSSIFMHMTPQQMQQMMGNPQMMTQWHQTMINDPQAMNSWMNTMMGNPQAMQQMHDLMINNPQHMQTMMNTMGPSMMNSMMSNPQMSQQMMGMMMQNQQFMQGMMMSPQFQQNWMGPWMSNSTNWQGMMGSGWMNPGMMGNNMMGSGTMMGTPITKNSEVMSTINNVKKLLDQVSVRYNDGDVSGAFGLATEAYLENYEYVESAIAAKDLNLMEKIEFMLRVELRSMIQNEDPIEDIDAKINSIKENLDDAKSLFQ
ncbi:hypothetical protein QVH35_09160 [Candidatus Nitrosotenuis chungbukensis]|uniref:hypothetical protein n=1 Tax=Candidatus Nitrosotenuis chungbukensis TaxID=1353246 RepID=UPI000B2F07FE|nr:hypothetical protein [Candidatus Nitrosotenuis chungbukensis]WKT57524.1 hypothetical protein QVH35_09160 [Candidatus Nitrosotenuis chungbukensis]